MIVKLGSRLSVRRFDGGPEPRETEIPALDSLAASEHILLREAFPDGRRWLLTGPAQPAHAPETFVIDEQGRILYSLGWEVAWSSVSADGRFVVGDLEVDRDEDVASAQLFVGHAAGAWRAPVPGVDYAIGPRLSRPGLFIVYQGRDSVHIGRLEIGGE